MQGVAVELQNDDGTPTTVLLTTAVAADLASEAARLCAELLGLAGNAGCHATVASVVGARQRAAQAEASGLPQLTLADAAALGRSAGAATVGQRLEVLRDLAKLGPSDRVLEVGCGTLELARALIDQVAAYECVEHPSTAWQNAAAFAADPALLQRWLARGAVLVESAGGDGGLGGGERRRRRRMSIVFAHDVLTHTPIDGVPAFFADAYAALRPGGVLLAKANRAQRDSLHTEWTYVGSTRSTLLLLLLLLRRGRCCCCCCYYY